MGFKLTILMPQAPKFWNCKHVPPHPTPKGHNFKVILPQRKTLYNPTKKTGMLKLMKEDQMVNNSEGTPKDKELCSKWSSSFLI
jgi:hypothetical protein